MSQSKKRKKKRYPGTASARSQDPMVLQDSRPQKRMVPLARNLLLFDLILLALVQILNQAEIISTATGDVLTLLALILLIAAIVVQVRTMAAQRGEGRHNHGGPHL